MWDELWCSVRMIMIAMSQRPLTYKCVIFFNFFERKLLNIRQFNECWVLEAMESLPLNQQYVLTKEQSSPNISPVSHNNKTSSFCLWDFISSLLSYNLYILYFSVYIFIFFCIFRLIFKLLV